MIEIEVLGRSKKVKLIEPILCFGAEHGEVYQQYVHGKPTNEYLVGAGYCERPISIWYDDESKKFRLSSESKKDLKAFLSHVKYAKIDANVYVTLEVK